MKSKVNLRLKKQKKRKPKLSEINELSLSIFIIKRVEENRLKERIKQLEGEIVSITRGIGVSRATVFESLKIGTEDVSVFFVLSRIEDVRDFMQTITEEFNLCVPGNGKGFVIDIDGYLGAKAVFID